MVCHLLVCMRLKIGIRIREALDGRGGSVGFLRLHEAYFIRDMVVPLWKQSIIQYCRILCTSLSSTKTGLITYP